LVLDLHLHPLSPPFPTRRSSDLTTLPNAHLRSGAVRLRVTRQHVREVHRVLADSDHVPLLVSYAHRSGVYRSSSGFRVRSSGFSDRKSTRLNSSHEWNSYSVFCL